MILRIWIGLLFAFCCCYAETARYIPTHEELTYTFGGNAPVMRVKPGTILESWTEDCYDGSIKSPNDIPSKVAPIGRDNPQTGPFYVEGAKPGDIVAVHILDLQPARDYAVSSHYPGFGTLTGTDYTALLNPLLPERFGWYKG